MRFALYETAAGLTEIPEDMWDLPKKLEKYHHYVLDSKPEYAPNFPRSFILYWLWDRFYNSVKDTNLPKIFNFRKLSTPDFSHKSISYLTSYFGLDAPDAFTDPNHKKTFTITYFYIQQGIINTIQQLQTVENAYKRLKPLELAFMETSHTRIRIYQTINNEILIITSLPVQNVVAKAIGMLPIFYPDLHEHLQNTENNALLTIFKAFYDNTPEILIPFIEQDYAVLQTQLDDTNIKNFEQALKKRLNHQAIKLKNDIDLLRGSIASQYTQIEKNEATLNDYIAQLAGYEQQNKAIDTNAIQFLRNSQILTIEQCNIDYVKMRVTTPLSNYIPEDMKAYYKTENFVTEIPWKAALLKELFITGTYQLITTTYVTVPLNRGNWTVTADSPYHLGNPHLSGFQCFRAAQHAMNNFIEKGEILNFLNQLIATCASINVLDSTVLRYLTDNLSTFGYKQNILKNTETGELISPEQYKQIFYTNI